MMLETELTNAMQHDKDLARENRELKERIRQLEMNAKRKNRSQSSGSQV